MILGTISAVDEEVGLQLIIDGEDEATTKKYTYMASYVPAEGDRVLIEEVGGSYVIIGKIITETSNSGIANFATNAANAQNAQNAANAQNAQTAQTAASATSAELAATATLATSATLAARATTADLATRATSADVATQVYIGARSDSIDGSDRGMLVTRVSREYNSTIGGYIVTDVQTSFDKNYLYT